MTGEIRNMHRREGRGSAIIGGKGCLCYYSKEMHVGMKIHWWGDTAGVPGRRALSRKHNVLARCATQLCMKEWGKRLACAALRQAGRLVAAWRGAAAKAA